ncbi:MAG: GNAT family N-acetyltransferase [candidate division Zixibacteria bacterium]|nr:GNAT family N-acetyltransferase [candidate division Zixibacteria bacterium]
MKKNEDLGQFPTSPALIGKKVYLRASAPDDYLEVHQWFNASDPQSQTCHVSRIISPEDKVKKMHKKEFRDDEGRFVIIAKNDHRLVGEIAFFHMNMLNRSAELGYLISPAERGNGFAKEALQLIIKYLFLDMNLNKVYAQTASFNKASVKLLESFEFKLDGTLRQHHYFKGDLYDDLVYSLLKFEYGPPE